MDRYTDWHRYEPDAIHKALPLEWAVGHLFDTWGAGADMMSCPLPGHQDSTPSFNLWAEDEDGFPQRYGCFGCGANGDVVDLIRLARGVGFLDACRIAVEELVPDMEASDWRPTERTAARTLAKSHDELTKVLERITGTGDLNTFLQRKNMLDAGDVHTEWGWGTFRTPAPVAYFPHWGWDGKLTGIRYRSVRRDGTRWTERGSRFPALYGAWRDTKLPSVLLCEGETDTVWAASQLRGRPFDVMGLASGAAQKPPEDAIRRLSMRNVWLAFDADMAGRIAIAQWREALEGVAYQVRVVPVPEGHDVLSCGVPVSDLLKQTT